MFYICNRFEFLASVVIHCKYIDNFISSTYNVSCNFFQIILYIIVYIKLCLFIPFSQPSSRDFDGSLGCSVSDMKNVE